MFAEIHNKVPKEWQDNKAVLTSSFFGLMRYTSAFYPVLGRLLYTAKFKDIIQESRFKKALYRIPKDWELQFWSKLGAKEIDICIVSHEAKVVIGIEPNYQIDYSKNQGSSNQLAVYADLLQRKYGAYKQYLICLAKVADASRIYDSSYEKVERLKPTGFGYCSWEGFYRKLDTMIGYEHPNQTIINDLKQYLASKGLTGFSTFDLENLGYPKIDKQLNFNWV